MPAASAEIIDANLYKWFSGHRKGSGLRGRARPSQESVKDGGEVPFLSFLYVQARQQDNQPESVSFEQSSSCSLKD